MKTETRMCGYGYLGDTIRDLLDGVPADRYTDLKIVPLSDVLVAVVAIYEA